MSIRRPKRPSRKAEPDLPTSSGSGASGTAALPEWNTAVAARPDDAFVPYAPSTTFPVSTLVRHTKFGKGIVIAVDGNKVDILFEQGIRKLLHATPA